MIGGRLSYLRVIYYLLSEIFTSGISEGCSTGDMVGKTNNLILCHLSCQEKIEKMIHHRMLKMIHHRMQESKVHKLGLCSGNEVEARLASEQMRPLTMNVSQFPFLSFKASFVTLIYNLCSWCIPII